MGMLRAIYLTLISALVLVECAVKRNDHCQAIVECQKPLQHFLIDQGQLPTYFSISDQETLNHFCEKVNTAKECMDEHKSGCDNTDIVSGIEGVESGVSYLCSDEGRQDALALSQSECANDEHKQLELIEGIQVCVESFQFEVLMLTVGAVSENKQLQPSDLCPYIDSFVDCAITVARDKCGEAYAKFIHNLMDSSEGVKLDELGCSENIEKIRRGLIYIKRKRVIY